MFADFTFSFITRQEYHGALRVQMKDKGIWRLQYDL
jgi:hypothetical protein